MDFKTVDRASHPAYTWLWNTTVTKEGIQRQMEQMYRAGIRAFYILGEPENFRPTLRRTHLHPEYLSSEYLALLQYAWSLAEEKGMEMWLYNEGGFPSGMVCGKIREAYPELAIKEIGITKVPLAAGSKYTPPANTMAVFAEGQRLTDKTCFDRPVTLTEYRQIDGVRIRTDNASLKNTELFLEMTHEKLKGALGKSIGSRIRLMFDDEAYMGTWTEGYEKIFFDTYGYDVCDYLPYVSGELSPETQQQYRAVSDYVMLCGELVRKNYFLPMKQWLNANNMLSTGHLDRDNFSHGCRDVRYGNVLQTLRTFDVPGVDVIWSQISYPEKGSGCLEGYPFYPRVASSAANQCGHSNAVSESFAVYGAQVTPELMRYVVNYQAVRGISLFNFMVISYDRETAMCLQYRPNYIEESPGMDNLTEINAYTARLSDILRKSRPEISTALYFPFRSICAGGEFGKKAEAAFEALGKNLETKGVSFDLIDEDFVLSAERQEQALVGEYVRYDNVFVPEGFLEKEEVLQKLSGLGSRIKPCIMRQNKDILARKLLLPEDEEVYLICNLSGELVAETVEIFSAKRPYLVDLYTGALQLPEYTRDKTVIKLPVNLLRGEAVAVYLSDREYPAKPKAYVRSSVLLTDITGYVSREYRLDPENGPENSYPAPGSRPVELGGWDPAFSGEVTYTAVLPELPDGMLYLDLGKVNHTVRIFMNGKPAGEKTMPPYVIPLPGAKRGDVLTIVVANTIANACANTAYFDKQDIRDVGPYHANMIKYEELAPAGGLFGPVRVLLVQE